MIQSLWLFITLLWQTLQRMNQAQIILLSHFMCDKTSSGQRASWGKVRWEVTEENNAHKCFWSLHNSSEESEKRAFPLSWHILSKNHDKQGECLSPDEQRSISQVCFRVHMVGGQVGHCLFISLWT